MSEASGRSPSVRRAAKARHKGYWLIGGGLIFILGAVWLFFYVTGERVLPYLGREPLTASINRVSSNIDASGYCETEVWRLSGESLSTLRSRGAEALAPPHRFKPGFQPAEWRPLSVIDPAELPWSPRKCRADARAELLRYARQEHGFAAVMVREDEEGRRDHALFLLALDDGYFARALFSGEAVGRLAQ